MHLTEVKPLAVWHSVFQGGETGQEVQGNISHITDLFQNFTFWEGLWQFCLYDDDFSDYRTSVQIGWHLEKDKGPSRITQNTISRQCLCLLP